MRVLVAPLLASLLLSAPVRAAGFQPGEAFTYKFSVGIVEAGRARMSVGLPEKLPGGVLVGVQGDAHSSSWLRWIARLDDNYKVVLDATTMLPRKVSSNETGVRERRIESEMDGRQLKIEMTSAKGSGRWVRTLPGPPCDPVGALFLLRAARLADADVVEFLALDGVALYQARATVHGRERLERESGPSVMTIRVDVTAVQVYDNGQLVPSKDKPRAISIWFSDDDARIPYRMAGDTDLGVARLELTSYSVSRQK